MLKKEVVWFVVVGTIGATVDFGIFNLLIATGQELIWSSLISVSLAGLIVFSGNLLLTFSHVTVRSKANAALKFFGLTLLTVLANNALVTLALLAMDSPGVIESNLVKISVVALLVVGRFLAMKFLIYVR